MLLQGYLVGEQLQRGGAVVRGVADVLLRPDQVLHHQHEEDEEAEEVGPDVDSLVVEPEDAAETVLVVQPLAVAGDDGDLLVLLRHLLHRQQRELLAVAAVAVVGVVGEGGGQDGGDLGGVQGGAGHGAAVLQCCRRYTRAAGNAPNTLVTFAALQHSYDVRMCGKKENTTEHDTNHHYLDIINYICASYLDHIQQLEDRVFVNDMIYLQ